MKGYLACYDYRTGGFWWRIYAPSAEAVRTAFPVLTVFDTEPAWWKSREMGNIPEFRLGDPPDEFLLNLLNDPKSER